MICAIGRADNLQRHDDVQRDRPFVADGIFQRRHPRVENSDHRQEDMGTIQAVLPPITLREEKSGKNCRRRGVYCGGAKHIWYTNSPSIRAS